MDVADRWDLGQRMDSEIGELMPTMDEEAKFKRVLNGLTGKLGKITYFQYIAISIIGNILVSCFLVFYSISFFSAIRIGSFL